MNTALTRAAGVAKAGLEGLGDLVWPRGCPLCGERGEEGEGGFCFVCLAGMARLEDPICIQCGRRLGEDRTPASGICGACQLDPPAYGRARAWGEYRGFLGHAVRRFKFQGNRPLAAGLSRLLAAADEHWLAEFEAHAVAPMPLHPMRLAERGFNQAVDLARPVARRRKVPILYSALVRVRDTRPQYGLTVSQRHDNVNQAFQVARPQAVSGKNLLLVDDVLTTGATAAAAARALTRAGAAAVVVLTLARTPRT
jgi:ComF family protein